MIFTKDETGQKVLATVLGPQHKKASYECVLTMCPDPLCTCNMVSIQFVPSPAPPEGEMPAEDMRITLNVESRQAERDPHADDAQPGHTDFQQSVLAHLQDEDYQFLFQEHLHYKRAITKHADLASLHVEFPITDIERNSTMIGYTEVFPYGDSFRLTLGAHQYLLFDQYCVKPHCSCVDTVVSCILLHPHGHGHSGEDLAAYTINYKKRRWERFDKEIPVSGPIGNVKVLKHATESAYPTLYARLQERHTHLKQLYAQCLKEHGIGQPRISTRTVGRNEPCPCGSGKKFKKCCLNKTV